LSVTSIASATGQRATGLRTIATATASTAHLTQAELKAINDAFDVEQTGLVQRCRDEILHNGLYASPTHFGFIFRIPSPEILAEKLAMCSPEMRTLVTMASTQGANRIEFDADEDVTIGIAVYEH